MVKIADWVTTNMGGRGIVRRVAKDGTWADVRWRSGRDEWSKRMPVTSLIVRTSIDTGGMVVTDLTRESEIEQQG